MRLVRYFNSSGTLLVLPFFLFLIIHKSTQPSIDPDENIIYAGAFHDDKHIDYPVYNPECAKFTGNVDSPYYLNYTQSHYKFPIISANSTWHNVLYHFAVNTAPKSYLARRMIRRTWQRTLQENVINGKAACSGSVRFYVGQTSDKVIARRLHQELKEHSDMVFIEFCDKYENLPLKTVNIMRHVAATAPAATKFVVKIDDDVLPNFPLFFDCFPTLVRPNYGIYGWVTLDTITPEKWDKYRIPQSRWNATKLPAFAHGPSYVIRLEELPKLLTRARMMPMINLEDVWFTGIVAEAVHVKRFDVLRFVVAGRTTVDLQHNAHITDKAGFFYHNVGPLMMKKFWRRISKCCGCFKHCSAFSPKPTTRGSMKSELILDEDV